MKVNRGEGRFELPQQPFVEVDSQGWMVASLEQDPGPPGRVSSTFFAIISNGRTYAPCSSGLWQKTQKRQR